jgi:hypothetical protein
MAITIKSAPQASGYVSANEDVWHVADSTNKAVVGFKYLFDIYKGAELLTRVTNSPYGVDQYGVINVGNIVRSAVAVDTLGDLDMSTSYTGTYGVINAGADYWWGEYDLRYGEICGTTTTENDASGTYRVYNTYNRHPMHKAGAALSSGTPFLTNRPDESYFYDGEPVILSINNKVATVGQTIAVMVYDVTFRTRLLTAIDGMQYFSLNNLTKDSDVDFTRGATLLATKKLKKRCSKYTPYTLVFLNAYGAWDSFTFVNGNVMTDNQKKKFEQMEWKLSGFNMVNKTGKVLYEGMRTYGSEFNTKMKLTTDLLNSDEYIWLFELIVSPLVYLWDKTANLFHPVQITDSNYEIKNSLQNKTETLDINIDVYKQNTQYR